MATRIVIIGGFLGAGKTTLMTRLARDLAKEGRSVAVITNDQGEVLVDTQYSKSLGLNVSEVLRGCFCCRFQDFLTSARNLVSIGRPDYILAEPVGSCTDLMATVIAPLKLMYPQEFQVAPLMILVDSTWLIGDRAGDDSINTYLRKHQITEADVVVFSKADLVPRERYEEMQDLVKDLNPSASMIPYSSVTGTGLPEIMEKVKSNLTSSHRPVDVDYDIYAQAEAELGWYNGSFHFSVGERLDAYDLAMRIIKEISGRFDEYEIAHVKLLLTSESNALKMNLVGRSITIDGVRGSRYGSGRTSLIVNARVVSSPEKLMESIRRSVSDSVQSLGLHMEGFDDTCFSPSRPQPTHRILGDQ